MRKIIFIIAICGIVFCGCGNRIFSTPIGAILKNPRNYEGKVVKVSGEVTQSMNLLLMKYFAIKDNTGEIYIVTDRILPKQGDSAKVTGHVQEGFSIGPSQFIVIVEDSENQQKTE